MILQDRFRHKRIVRLILPTLLGLLVSLIPLVACAQTTKQQQPEVSRPDFSSIDRLMAQTLESHLIPGAVIVVGHDGHIVFEKAYGDRSYLPTPEPMTTGTIFDLASLTKVLATTTAAMQLYEQGRFRLNDPLSKYLPAFAANGKQSITIRQIMTHYSGLPPDLSLAGAWRGKQAAYQMAFAVKPMWPAGTRFCYSDINFILMGALVEKLSGMPLNEYVQKNVFAPLGMTHTRFLPPAAWQPEIAPTAYDAQHVMLQGVVNDPTARRMGGVAGHAGLFSNAHDLSIFAQNLLDLLAGKPSKFPLNRITAQKMTTPQNPANGVALRGLGWDIESPFSGNRGEIFPVGGFGHTGWTGTDLWMDPWSDSYVIFLSNRNYPDRDPSTIPLEAQIANDAAEALNIQIPERGSEIARLTGYNESLAGLRRYAARNGEVENGIDVLEDEHFAPLARLAQQHGGHLRVGILTNYTATDSQGRRDIDVLDHQAEAAVPGLKLTTIFSPEGGISGMLDTEHIPNSTDPTTGLPIVSLYGATSAERHPPIDKLRNLDAVVVDLRDVGVRFYTYETALGYLLEAGAKTGTEIIVLDRPDPITGSFVQGPISDASSTSYTDFMPLPARHGMTLGEIARYFNGVKHIGAPLTVVAVKGWQRGDWYDSTSLLWVDPSPNLRNLKETTLYPGIGMIESSNISVGRGTDTPFDWIGAPWINATAFARALNRRMIPGIRFLPVEFTPKAPYPYAGKLCQGVGFVILNRNVLNSPELGIEIAAMLYKMYPNQYQIKKINHLLDNQTTMNMLLDHVDPDTIAESWQAGIDAFLAQRKPYLLYPTN